jgi:hypothetical protein
MDELVWRPRRNKPRSRQEQAFSAYFALGPSRSLAELANVLRDETGDYGLTRPPSLRTIETWSIRGQWQQRLADLERRAREEVDREHLAWLKDHRERLRERGRLLQDRGIEWLLEKDAGDVKASDAIRAIEAGVRLEALALTETMQRTAPSGDKPKFEVLNDAEWTYFCNLVRAVFGNHTVGR